MKLKPNGSNQTVIVVGDAEILFSYSTPVAYSGPEGCFKTEVKHSVTTSRHINQWGANGFPTRPQTWFDNLLSEGPTP